MEARLGTIDRGTVARLSQEVAANSSQLSGSNLQERAIFAEFWHLLSSYRQHIPERMRGPPASVQAWSSTTLAFPSVLPSSLRSFTSSFLPPSSHRALGRPDRSQSSTRSPSLSGSSVVLKFCCSG
ncbi:hypothetical protein Mapa_008918 [Marchantia paleacea]|nr:hypothetical protein Mapa_008918 [Marchantia paleacea]